ncbi:MAG: amidohydrolase [Chloroflexi bacterium]|nr:amidohydrolase [Chloroflexota bacterium]
MPLPIEGQEGLTARTRDHFSRIIPLMTDTSTAKSIAASAIDARSEGLIALSKDIWDHPEPGFREHRTAQVTADFMREIGLAARENIAITGVIARINTGRPGPHVAIMGELDSLIVPEHRDADSASGAVHVCGHNIQIGNMLAAAVGLSQPEVLATLSGSISFMAVPAEEYIEIEFREGLREAGELEFLAGKQEFIRLGELDDVDISLLTHVETSELTALRPAVSLNGMIAKRVRFIGRSAHAGGSPELGINALNAANLAMQGIHAQRETFKDDDHVRVHPILTRGGAAVSSVPANVTMEMFVRAATVEAMEDAAAKVDRALKAGAMAVGATVEISTSPGYLPAKFHEGLGELYDEVVTDLIGKSGVGRMPHRTSSTDMGDVSQIMPTIHPYVGGARGRNHSDDFDITDWDLDVIDAGKAMANTTIELLGNGAVRGREIADNFDAPLSISEYLAVVRGYQATEKWSGSSPSLLGDRKGSGPQIPFSFS